eukprot:CAMPEP_0170478760 /NCGR_PEP_ID=MMETSP0208-20121228/230_1 /TAXON_ID=197538 /ORGANISM="Strombidium inclinatum, Strain S3" /LENGTH=64 /DNA_ID=CAMNT_0010751067 /DNA_START=41 /DNA_END=235 /DNA_ORIENTATION=-
MTDVEFNTSGEECQTPLNGDYTIPENCEVFKTENACNLYQLNEAHTEVTSCYLPSECLTVAEDP